MPVTKDHWLPEYHELDHEEIRLSSPALKAGATHFGKYCDEVCKEYMLCRTEENDPRRCIQEGKDVTTCGLEFFRKVKKHCYEPFEKHWRCLENKSPEMYPRFRLVPKVKTYGINQTPSIGGSLDNNVPPAPKLPLGVCRPTQAAFDHCMSERFGQERPPAGYFAQVRIHDSTKRPVPPKMPIREYEDVPKLPKDYPKPDPTLGGRGHIGV